MKLLERAKLILRALKYKKKDDIGGIAYLTSTIQNGDTVLDIGAHKAGYLYFIQKKVGPVGKIYAFEPQSNLYLYIKKMKDIFNWNNLTIEHLALSDSAGSVTLFIPANRKSNASSPGATIVEQLKNKTGPGRTEIVSTETLDAYCNRNHIQPGLLKIDVEGNELKIFQGGIETLKKYKPKIMVEIEALHVGQQQVLKTFTFLESLGYSGYFIHGLNRIPLATFNFNGYQNINDRKNYCNNFVFE